jgi:peptidoglycan/xylan/chitin deacetylase (PgdA/CDA1 family)
LEKDSSRANNYRWTLTWDEVNEMSQNKVSFGSHGCSHRIMTTLSTDEIKRELRDSKFAIQAKLGIKIDHFSYPNGDFTGAIKDLVKEAGYTSAATTKGKNEDSANPDLFALKRIGVHEGISVGLRGKYSRAMFSFHLMRNS